MQGSGSVVDAAPSGVDVSSRMSIGGPFVGGAGTDHAKLLLRLPVRDCTGGFKAWRRDLLGRLDLDLADARGYAFQIQTTLQAVRAGARVVEVPIYFKEREHGTSKMTTAIALEAVSGVWKMRSDLPKARVNS